MLGFAGEYISESCSPRYLPLSFVLPAQLAEFRLARVQPGVFVERMVSWKGAWSINLVGLLMD